MKKQELTPPQTPNKTNILSFRDIFNGYGSIEHIRTAREKEVLAGFVVDEGMNVWVGKGGSGKTHLAYHFLIWLLKLLYNIIYIDLDNPVSLPVQRGLVDKIIELGKEDHVKYFNQSTYVELFKEKKVSSINSFVRTILKQAVEFKKQNPDERLVVFIDSFQDVVDDVSSDSSVFEFLNVLRLLTTYDITVIVLHHVAKIGWFKGSTLIRDACDMMYVIKDTIRDVGGGIEQYILHAEKARYFGHEDVTIKLTGDFEFEVLGDAVKEKLEHTILKTAVYTLKKGEMIQKDLVNVIKNKIMGEVGRDRIVNIIKEYARKGLFNVEQRERNTRIYKLNKDSDLLGIFE